MNKSLQQGNYQFWFLNNFLSLINCSDYDYGCFVSFFKFLFSIGFFISFLGTIGVVPVGKMTYVIEIVHLKLDVLASIGKPLVSHIYVSKQAKSNYGL
jgi:transcriptional antiterminator Rof (Rho-off)